jgi:hypothetical protein
VIGAVLFLALDVVLIGFALNRDDAPSSDATPGPIPTFGVPRTPSPTPTPESTAAPAALAQPRYLVATSATTAWRASVGNCSGDDAVLESTVDGGVTWQTANPPGVHQILNLSADAGSVSVVARIGAECSLDVLKSFTDGEFWNSDPSAVSGVTLLDPSDAGIVHTADGPLRAPCSAAHQVQERDDALVVLCNDQLFESTGAAGAWLSVSVPSLLAIAPSDAGYTLAVADLPDCAGISVQTLPAPSGTAPPTVVGCVTLQDPLSQVTISQSGSTVWLWNATQISTSGDDGATWTLPSAG